MNTFMNNWLLRRAMSAPRGPKEYIQFADPAVEAICIANWSSDGIGLTMQDAAAVTSVGSAFRNNSSITSFYEFIYFTGVTNIDYDMFTGSPNIHAIGLPSSIVTRGFRNSSQFTDIYISDIDSFLLARYNGFYTSANGSHLYLNGEEVTSIVFPNDITFVVRGCLYGFSSITQVSIPNSVTAINENSFQYCGLQSITMPDSLEQIKDEAFHSCSGLSGKTVDFPASLTSIGVNAFRNISNMVFVMRAETPPVVRQEYGTLSSVRVIYVPYSADHSILNAYKTADKWSVHASKIYELNPDGTIPS